MELAPATTVRQLAAKFNVQPEKVAIEINRRIIRGVTYDRELHDGDQIEIVTFVGGG